MSPATRLYLIGVLVLLAGLSIGGVILWQHPPDDAETDDDVLAMQYQSKAYDQAVQRNVGATGLLMSQVAHALEEFARPRPLAITLMCVCGATTVGFFVAAARRGG